MNAQLKSHMEKGILGPSQHAYRKHKSTQSAWVELDTKIRKATDQGKYVGLILVDMSAAFNLVSKAVIIPKLKEMGVGPFAIKLLESYLTGRKSRVKIKGKLSSWIEVLTGIGEGSVLGPLVFILTIVCVTVVLARAIIKLQALGITAATDKTPDTQAQVELSSVEFADDVTGIAIADTEQQVQLALQTLADEYDQYFGAHGLKINVAKSEHMVIGSPRTMTIKVDNRDEAKSVKLLGLTFDRNYCFNQHVENVTRKMTERNVQLRKVANVADLQTTRMVAMANILSVANYCSEVYASEPKMVNRVQIKINQTMRIVTNSGNRARIREMQEKLQWLSFKETIEYNQIVMLNKLMSTAASPYTFMLIQKAMMANQNPYPRRVTELRIAWQPRLIRKGMMSFIYKSVKLYNQSKLMGKMIENDAFKDEVKAIIKSWRK